MRLRELRRQRGLTQEALEALSGVPQSTISHLEKSPMTPHLRNVMRLARALNVSVEELAGDESEEGETT